MKIYSWVIGLAVMAAQIMAAPIVAAADLTTGLQLKNAGRLAEAEQEFLTVLAIEPNDVKALEQLAVVQSWQNKFDVSIASWRRLLSFTPDDVNARIGLARVLYWHNQRQASQQLLTEVTRAQPDNTSAWTLLGDVQLADGNISDARASYSHALRLNGGNDAELQKRIARAVPPKQWRFDAGIVADRFSQERSNENSEYLQLGYTTAGKTTWYGKWERYEQFGQTDQSVGVGVYFLPSTHWLFNVEWNNAGSDAHFRPQSQLGVNIDWLLNRRVQPLLSYRDGDYDSATSSGSVTTITPGLRVLFNNMNIELKHARTTNLDDSKTTVNSIKLNWDGEIYRPYLAYTTGEEATPPLAIAEIDVVSAGLVWSINAAWGARIDIAREDRKNTYQHDSLGFGVSYFF